MFFSYNVHNCRLEVISYDYVYMIFYDGKSMIVFGRITGLVVSYRLCNEMSDSTEIYAIHV